MSDRKGMGCGSAILLITVLGFVTYCALRDPPTPEEVAAEQQAKERRQARADEKRAAERAVTDEYGSRSMAVALAKNAINNLLKSPSTAKFQSEFTIKHYQDDHTHTVVGWVDAQNSFGATLRTDWQVEIEYTPIDTWEITGLVFMGKTVIASSPSGRPKPDRRDRPPSRVPEAAAASTAFERFEVLFDESSLRVRTAPGVVFFTGASDGGGGRLYVDATDTWMAGSVEVRRSDLNTIYNMWKVAQQGESDPIEVWIRGPDDRIVMRKP